ncbi:MAG: hypothetical protein ACJA0N_000996 [Pseudohongiellaceae bacterium]|jgi:hypothetical protein
MCGRFFAIFGYLATGVDDSLVAQYGSQALLATIAG